EQFADALRIDHYVRHVSSVASTDGQHVQLYVRERVLAATLARTGDLEGRVVLFVHGAGTPAEVAFDLPYEDYSWMGYLAAAGYDVFSVDMEGYGRSSRPHPMNDYCNLSQENQRALKLDGATCESSATGPATTIQSDWDDIAQALEYIRELRDVERISLFGWSLGGPRAGGYAAQFPEQVDKLVLLAPAYRRDLPGARPRGDDGAVMTYQTWESLNTLWNAQVGCENQYDPLAAQSIWSEMLASDPVGATWGPGMRRAPRTLVWGWNEAAVAQSTTPTLMVAAVHDVQVDAARVRDLYEDLGAQNKVLLDLGCASHNAMWERVHLELFSASLEWLEDGTVDGVSSGIVRRGY
ncbi:MAG TPA: alpha/beta fold hydrolase, partial [Gammaproteobacteria bacterium]|nr:alpha/beta fold hydrolase [Gammaproteobacteria bacterium]